MPRIYAKDLNQMSGKKIELFGWVHARRDHGGLIFVDLRDVSGLTQIIIDPKICKDIETAKTLRAESVVKILGKVKARPKNYINNKIISGKIEIECSNIQILNLAQTLPFEIDKNTQKINEEKRLEYRYLDLRSSRMAENLKNRHKVISFIHEYLNKEDFFEIETPILTKGTPEGAREYIVPSRLQKGKAYVLPQSPQQFKQLLMIAGFEKYYQIAKCFRDEDQRGDRQPEFTQLDLEMSFVEQKEILDLTEKMFIEMVEKLYPKKKITQKPWPRITYAEATAKYQTDKPDLRKNPKDPDELAFAFVIDFPLFKTENGKLVSEHHPFTAPQPDQIDLLEKNPEKVKSAAYDIVLNGYEIGSGSIRIHQAKLQKQIFQILGIKPEAVQEKFGHLLQALEFGAPPHGGIAPGLDRLIMILQNEPNIREVMAFPKTGDARDPMMKAPSTPDLLTLKELGIKFKE